MDPFTQRMLERARARQEKIDQKLANSGQAVPKRKPLTENISIVKNHAPPVKTSRESLSSPKKSTRELINCDTPIIKQVIQKSDQVMSQQRKNDVIVTKKEFKSPKSSLNRRNSDVSVEINISHRNDIQIEVQVEERDAPISIMYNPSECENNVVIQEINGDNELDKRALETAEQRSDKTNLRHNIKSRLDRLANLYSDNPTLSPPVYRSEEYMSSPPKDPQSTKPTNDGKKKFGRLAALADQINNWEDDLKHHALQPETKKTSSHKTKDEKMDSSTLDMSIHSFKDINKALQTAKSNKNSKQMNSHIFTRPNVNECQRLAKQIVAELVSGRYVSPFNILNYRHFK